MSGWSVILNNRVRSLVALYEYFEAIDQERVWTFLD